LIPDFLSNISVKYYENPTMLSRVIAKKPLGMFFETQCIVVITNSQLYPAALLTVETRHRMPDPRTPSRDDLEWYLEPCDNAVF